MDNFKRVCYKCEKRSPGCHAECPEYIAEDIIHGCIRDEQRRQKQIEDNLNSQRREQIVSSIKKKRK